MVREALQALAFDRGQAADGHALQRGYSRRTLRVESVADLGGRNWILCGVECDERSAIAIAIAIG